ncbi:hypothetical protein BASA60_009682 [Batrachochytrium salamandrivorans]|nr:hypothetical protein BASA60_009682 [Batrachochytrium salamandrivorans]KAH9272072.1 hypothetical protein BASA83_005660 [Batrachochytrium salamandrivorans]
MSCKLPPSSETTPEENPFEDELLLLAGHDSPKISHASPKMSHVSPKIGHASPKISNSVDPVGSKLRGLDEGGDLQKSNSSVRNMALAFETLTAFEDHALGRRQPSTESLTLKPATTLDPKSPLHTRSYSMSTTPEKVVSCPTRPYPSIINDVLLPKGLYMQNPDADPFADDDPLDAGFRHDADNASSRSFDSGAEAMESAASLATFSPETKIFALANSKLSHSTQMSSPGLLGHLDRDSVSSSSATPIALTASLPPTTNIVTSTSFPRMLGSPERPAPPIRSSRTVAAKSPATTLDLTNAIVPGGPTVPAKLQPPDSMSTHMADIRSPSRSNTEPFLSITHKPPLPPRPAHTPSPTPDLGLGLSGIQTAAYPTGTALLGTLPPPLPIRPTVRRVPTSLESSVSTPCLTDTLGRYASLTIKETIHVPITRSVYRSLPVAEGFPLDGVQHKGPVNAFSFSGVHAATGHVSARIWDISTNTNPHFYTPATDQKPHIFAVCFIPSTNVAMNNSVYWASVDRGELLEIDVASGHLLDRRVIHNSTVTHMISHRFSVYTLDETGGFKIWAPGESGRVELTSRPRGLRVAAKQQCVLVDTVDGIDRLWTSSGKYVEVYNLQLDALALVERKITLSPSVGSVTAIAALSTRQLIFTGHEDGKISVFDAAALVKLYTVEVGVYRISALVGLTGSYIWAGFSTGKIAVYDVASQIPRHSSTTSTTSTHSVNPAGGGLPNNDTWAVVMEFNAYLNSGVTHLTVDRSSLALTGKLLVGSVSETGHMRFWDGMLEIYQQDLAIRSLEAEYCDYNPIHAVILTWNIDARKPSDMDSSSDMEDKRFFGNLLSVNADADIFIFGFQELVDLESKSETAKQLFKGAGSNQTTMDQRQKLWQDRLASGLLEAFPQELYTMVECRQLVGLFQCVFVRSSLAVMLSNVSVSMVKTGLGGYHGNKGSIATRFLWQNTSFCFVNCHLAAHQAHISARNNDIAHILKETQFPKLAGDGIWMRGGDGSMIVDHEAIFWSGDLNYRIDLPRATVLEKIETQDWKILWENDQLRRQKSLNPSFGLRDFEEAALSFAPTFKYKRGTTLYDTSEKMRIPAYCDRILSRGSCITQTFLMRGECKISDHRPVAAGFRVMVKLINEERRSHHLAAVRVELERRLAIVVEEAKVEWVMAARRIESTDSQLLLEQCNWNLIHIQ